MKTYDFKELFGFEFGERRNVTVYPKDAGNEFMIMFKTPSHSEEDVRLSLPTMAFVFNQNILLETVMDNKVLYTDNRSFSYFVNKDGVDPKFGRPSGHPFVDIKIRDTHLEPNTWYGFHYKRAGSASAAARNPAAIQYFGTDKNEVAFSDSVPMTFGGITGFFVPDN